MGWPPGAAPYQVISDQLSQGPCKHEAVITWTDLRLNSFRNFIWSSTVRRTLKWELDFLRCDYLHRAVPMRVILTNTCPSSGNKSDQHFNRTKPLEMFFNAISTLHLILGCNILHQLEILWYRNNQTNIAISQSTILAFHKRLQPVNLVVLDKWAWIGVFCLVFLLKFVSSINWHHTWHLKYSIFCEKLRILHFCRYKHEIEQNLNKSELRPK